MIIFFVIYELTSLKEKSGKIKMDKFNFFVRSFLIPFIKIQKFHKQKIDKTLDDEENK